MQKRGYFKDYVLFALKTTGCSKQYDKIIEVAAVRVRNHKIVDGIHSFINPKKHIKQDIEKETSINDEKVKDAPVIEDFLPKFLDFLGDDLLIGHNISTFALRFLERDIKKCLDKEFDPDFVDILYLAKATTGIHVKNYKLKDLCDFFQISYENKWDALEECRLGYILYEKIGNFGKEDTDNTNDKGEKEMQDTYDDFAQYMNPPVEEDEPPVQEEKPAPAKADTPAKPAESKAADKPAKKCSPFYCYISGANVKYDTFKAYLDKMFSQISSCVLISDNFCGTDKLTKQYAKEKGYEVSIFTPTYIGVATRKEAFTERDTRIFGFLSMQKNKGMVCFYGKNSEQAQFYSGLAKKYKVTLKVKE